METTRRSVAGHHLTAVTKPLGCVVLMLRGTVWHLVADTDPSAFCTYLAASKCSTRVNVDVW